MGLLIKFLAPSLSALRYILWLMVAVQIIYWLLLFSAPEPFPSRPLPLEKNSLQHYQWRLFATPSAPRSMPKIELLGVISVSDGTNSSSRAAILIGGKRKLFAPEDDIIPGLRVKKINPNSVELLFAGNIKIVPLKKSPSR